MYNFLFLYLFFEVFSDLPNLFSFVWYSLLFDILITSVLFSCILFPAFVHLLCLSF